MGDSKEQIGRFSLLVILLGFIFIFSAVIGFFQSRPIMPFFGDDPDLSNIVSFGVGCLLIKMNTPKRKPQQVSLMKYKKD